MERLIDLEGLKLHTWRTPKEAKLWKIFLRSSAACRNASASNGTSKIKVVT